MKPTIRLTVFYILVSFSSYVHAETLAVTAQFRVHVFRRETDA